MQSVETVGKTLEEAKAAALEQLQVPEEQVRFEILEEPRKLLGFIGSASEYRVRATLITETDNQTEAADSGDVTEADMDEVSAEATGQDKEPSAETSAPAVKPILLPENESEANMEEQIAAQKAQQFLAETTALMDFHTDVVIQRVESGEVELEIRGENLGLLIGRHGQTLDALQFLAAVVANSGLEKGARIVVDAENYRARRREMLERMAFSNAEKAKETRQEVVIPGLRSYERRIIHLVLKDDPEIETYSEGEEPDRNIVISPRS